MSDSPNTTTDTGSTDIFKNLSPTQERTEERTEAERTEETKSEETTTDNSNNAYVDSLEASGGAESNTTSQTDTEKPEDEKTDEEKFERSEPDTESGIYGEAKPTEAFHAAYAESKAEENSDDYLYMKAWARLTGSTEAQVERLVESAREQGAPETAIYPINPETESDGLKWQLYEDIAVSDIKEQIQKLVSKDNASVS